MPNNDLYQNIMNEIAGDKNDQDRLERLIEHVARLSVDVHTLKGNLSANTNLTSQVVDSQAMMVSLVEKIDVDKMVGLLDAIDSMKGGIKVLGWLERPAKWIAAIGAAAAVIWSLWEHKS
jgi:hypothetical protein